MNRDLFNANKKMNDMQNVADPNWAGDVAFTSIESKINADKEATKYALRPLSDDGKVSKKPKKKQKKKGAETPVTKNSNVDYSSEDRPRFFSKGYVLFLSISSAILIIAITAFIIRFNIFLKDYEREYQASLPYHVMDDFITVFDSEDYVAVYDAMTEKEEPGKYETVENIASYLKEMTTDKEVTYVESNDFTDKTPSYHIVADNYIIGEVTLSQEENKRSYKLPNYVLDSFTMYTDAQWSASVKTYDGCKVYINDVEVTSDAIYRRDESSEKHFEGFTELPEDLYYKVEGLYEKPEIKVIDNYNQEAELTLNTTTGIYETKFSVPKEVEDEMIDFAKEAVGTYASVICREINDSSLDKYFTKGNTIVKEIKSNSGNLKYFPNHTTKEVEDKVVEFIPFSDDAYYCEIEHTQHMMLYGSRPKDVVTDTKFYYVKEDGKWKVCAITF